MKFYPIESAPKDGTPIWIRDTEKGEGPFLAYRLPQDDAWTIGSLEDWDNPIEATPMRIKHPRQWAPSSEKLT